MSVIPSSTLEALKAYIQTEVDGHYFYNEAAARTENKQGKEMYLSLALDEMAHAKKLADEYASLESQGLWLSPSELAEKGRARSASFPIFPADEAKIAAMIPEGSDDLAALKVAIDIEKKSYSLYAEAAKTATDEKARALYEELMREEKGHLNLIQSSYDYLFSSGNWFQTQERPIFEG